MQIVFSQVVATEGLFFASVDSHTIRIRWKDEDVYGNSTKSHDFFFPGCVGEMSFYTI